MPYIPFAMILRQQSYTISRSLTCLPASPRLAALLGKRSFVHFENATFFVGLGFHLLSYSMQSYSSQGSGCGEENDPPHSFSKGTRTQVYTPNVSNRRGFCLSLVSSWKRHPYPLILYHWGQGEHLSAQDRQWYNTAPCQLWK